MQKRLLAEHQIGLGKTLSHLLKGEAFGERNTACRRLPQPFVDELMHRLGRRQVEVRARQVSRTITAQLLPVSRIENRRTAYYPLLS